MTDRATPEDGLEEQLATAPEEHCSFQTSLCSLHDAVNDAHQETLHASSGRSSARKKNARRKQRYPASGVLRVLWEDSTGRERISKAELIDVSVSGLQLQLEEKIPVHTYLTCNAPDLGISGRGSVRYCNFLKGKYRAGVEFTGGTGWREPGQQLVKRSVAG